MIVNLNDIEILNYILTGINLAHKGQREYFLWENIEDADSSFSCVLEIREKNAENPEFGETRLRLTKAVDEPPSPMLKIKTRNELSQGMMLMLFTSGINSSIPNPEITKQN